MGLEDGKNPFKATDDEKPTTAEQDSDKPKDDSPTAKVGPGEGGGEEQDPVHELFADDPEETAGEGLFDDDPDAEAPEGWTKGTWKRFRQVIGQRNDARADLKTEQKLREAAEKRAGEGLAEIRAAYPQHDNPVEAALWDAQYMSALEAAAKTDAAVARVAQAVKERMDSGRSISVPNAIDTIRPGAETPAAESGESAKLARRLAEQTIDTTLADLKPYFRKTIATEILASGASLADLTPADVKRAARAHIRENGLKAADVVAAAPAEAKEGDESEEKAKLPKTTSGAGKPAQAPRKERKPGEADEPQGAKTREEWERNRESAVQNFVAGSANQ